MLYSIYQMNEVNKMSNAEYWEEKMRHANNDDDYYFYKTKWKEAVKLDRENEFIEHKKLVAEVKKRLDITELL